MKKTTLTADQIEKIFHDLIEVPLLQSYPQGIRFKTEVAQNRFKKQNITPKEFLRHVVEFSSMMEINDDFVGTTCRKTYDAATNAVQCENNRSNRSADDLFLLCQYYYPGELSLIDVHTLLLELHFEGKINMLYCGHIEKQVFCHTTRHSGFMTYGSSDTYRSQHDNVFSTGERFSNYFNTLEVLTVCRPHLHPLVVADMNRRHISTAYRCLFE